MPIYKELLFIPISTFFCVKKIIATNYFFVIANFKSNSLVDGVSLYEIQEIL